MTLIDKALKYSSKSIASASNEEIDLAFAWLSGSITTAQYHHAVYVNDKLMMGKNSKTLVRIANVLRIAYRDGFLFIKK